MIRFGNKVLPAQHVSTQEYMEILCTLAKVYFDVDGQ